MKIEIARQVISGFQRDCWHFLLIIQNFIFFRKKFEFRMKNPNSCLLVVGIDGTFLFSIYSFATTLRISLQLNMARGHAFEISRWNWNFFYKKLELNNEQYHQRYRGVVRFWVSQSENKIKFWKMFLFIKSIQIRSLVHFH